MSILGFDLFGIQAERDRLEAIAFYGEAAYRQIEQSEKRAREDERLRREVLPQLVDDVAGQVRP